MTARRPDVDVVVVGLGPTGLTLAHALGMRGASVLVLEREPAFYGNARAVYTDGECMRIFQSIGMADRLARDMVEDAPVQFWLADGSCLGTLMSADRPWGWGMSQFFYQPFLETALADGLEAYPNVRVLRGREVVRFEQDEDGVDVLHVACAGTAYGTAAAPAETGVRTDETHVRARWLVGADGGRSLVRTQIGIGMTGRSFPNPWLVVDIQAKEGLQGLRHLPYFAFVCDPDRPTVCCVQPRGHHRFEFMLAPGQTREEIEDPEMVRRLLSAFVDVDRFVILRKLVYTFNALVAERWRDRRVLLAGDAAHMTPQFIGQGMNAGVRDAHNLAWKLHAVLEGRASERVLDTYESERRPHATAMIREAMRMKEFVSVSNPWMAALRNATFRLALRLPGVGPFIRNARFIPQPVYRRGGYLGLPRRGRSGPEGKLMPQPRVRMADGRSCRLDDALAHGAVPDDARARAPAGFALIGVRVDPRTSLGPAERAWCDAMGVRHAAMHPWGERWYGRAVARDFDETLLELEDLTGEWFGWVRRARVPRAGVIVLRPDGFVFAAVRAERLSEAIRALREQLGAPAAVPMRAVRAAPDEALVQCREAA
ncbi:MAG TPA: bifunctional 3-(3-hydroxy-phenyl)propionate/3-hydroxycinnamic acid hydroxylase [Caldimonas sp.]|nr:bifunctional 3-(3-hydroxy-phenyl)propionate/3-hydroxycinnamic acid hydroxylase [Caldimonas sp.]